MPRYCRRPPSDIRAPSTVGARPPLSASPGFTLGLRQASNMPTMERYPMKRVLMVLALLLTSALAGGCASVSVNASVAPNVDVKTLKTFYVRKLSADGRGMERLIADRLSKMGYTATSGTALHASQPVDAIVTYEDRWMWDITMYMLEMKIFLRDPSTEFVLASGHSFRTSLVRKPPEFMIEEALNKIFGLPPPVSSTPATE